MCCYKIRISIYVAESLKHSNHRKLLWGKEGNINIWKFHLGGAIRVRRHAAKIKGTCDQRGDGSCRHKAALRWCQPCSCASQTGSFLSSGSCTIILSVPSEPPKTCRAHGAPVVHNSALELIISGGWSLSLVFAPAKEWFRQAAVWRLGGCSFLSNCLPHQGKLFASGQTVVPFSN